MSSFITFQVIIIKSHSVNNDAAALTLASFKRSHLVFTHGLSLSGKVSLPGLSCHDVTDRVFPYGVVVFDGTVLEKTGPKDGTKFCGPRKML